MFFTLFSKQPLVAPCTEALRQGDGGVVLGANKVSCMHMC